MFEKAKFVKSGEAFDPKFVKDSNPSAVFYNEITVDALPEKAELNVCALGIGYVYVNGKRVSDELFPSPPSDYEKTLWQSRYI